MRIHIDTRAHIIELEKAGEIGSQEGQIFWDEETLYIWDDGWKKIGKGEESDARK